MSTREHDPTEHEGSESGDRGDPRPIPDGGLGSAMPAWLQKPPSWKRAGTPRPERTIPPPDTSSIDPGTMLDIDDLPQWLRTIAQRESSREAPAAEEPLPETSSGSGTGPRIVTSDEPARTPYGRIVSRPATTHPAHPIPIPPDRPPATGEDANASFVKSGSRPQPWWMSDGAIGGLLVAIILTMLYVVLVASGIL